MLLFISLFSTLVILAATIGSDSAPTRFNTEQTLNNGDRVAGFAALAGGLALANSATVGTFDSFFQVSGGPMDLNAGTLVLNQDLICYNGLYFNTLGNVVGQSHVVDLDCAISLFPLQPPTPTDSCIVSLVAQATTVANKTINTLDWSVSDTFVAVGLIAGGGSANTIEIWQWDGSSNLTFKNGINVNSKSINCVRWHPTLDWLAVATANNSGGNVLYIYSVDPSTAALVQLSAVSVGSDALSLAWHPTGNYLAVGTGVNHQQISVYPVSGVGVLGTPVFFDAGTISASTNGAASWDATGTYLAMGMVQSVSNPEIRIFQFGTSPLSLTQVVTSSPGSTVNSLEWHPTFTSLLAFGLSNNSSINTFLYNIDVNLGTATQVSQIANINKATQEVGWSPHGSCFALGTAIPNTSPFRVYSFSVANDSFTQTLGTGTAAANAVRWSRTTSSIGVGGSDAIIYVYQSAPTVLDVNGAGAFGQCFTWSNVYLVLNSDITLNNNCILFSGVSAINGRGHTITLTPNSRMFLDKGSTLSMENVTIEGVQNNVIGAYDNLSTFSFNNVEWALDGNYTFTMGKFDVIGDFVISGSGYTFSYQSQSTSNIYGLGGNMIIGSGVEFSYEPVTANNNLVRLMALTAELTLQGATLHATTTGINLTTGVLTLERASTIAADGFGVSPGIKFGDGVNSNSNLTVEILPAATMNVVNGCVVFNDA